MCGYFETLCYDERCTCRLSVYSLQHEERRLGFGINPKSIFVCVLHFIQRNDKRYFMDIIEMADFGFCVWIFFHFERVACRFVFAIVEPPSHCYTHRLLLKFNLLGIYEGNIVRTCMFGRILLQTKSSSFHDLETKNLRSANIASAKCKYENWTKIPFYEITAFKSMKLITANFRINSAAADGKMAEKSQQIVGRMQQEITGIVNNNLTQFLSCPFQCESRYRIFDAILLLQQYTISTTL